MPNESNLSQKIQKTIKYAKIVGLYDENWSFLCLDNKRVNSE